MSATVRGELVAVSWLLALLAGLLFAASLLGDGTGAFGSGVMRNGAWMWAVLGATALLWAGVASLVGRGGRPSAA